MKLSDFLVSSNVRRMYESKMAVHIESVPGSGKTSVMRKLPEVLSNIYGEQFGYVEVCLSHMDTPDVHGIPIPAKDTDGVVRVKLARAYIANLIEATGCKFGVLNLDEFAQCDPAMQKVSTKITLDRMIGDYAIPEGWMVVMTSNSTKHRSGANALLAHARNRIMMFSFPVDLDGWRTNFAEPRGLHFLWPAFTEFSASSFAHEVPPPDGAFCTLRSFTGLHDIIVGPGQLADRTCALNLDDFALDASIATIGEAEATKAFAFFKTHSELPSFAEIEANPAGAKCPGPDRMDVVYQVMGLLDQKVNGRNVDKVFPYVQRMPREFHVAMVRKFLNRSGGGVMLNAPSIRAFLTDPKNKALVMSGVAGDQR